MSSSAAAPKWQPPEKFRSDRSAWRRKRFLYSWLLKLKGAPLSEKSVVDYYYGSEVDRNAILLTGIGRGVSGNLKYILDELNSNDEYSDFRIYVRTTADETDDEVRRYIQERGWTRTFTVPKGYDRMLETCGYLLTESYFPYQFIRRPEQVMIDTWHGTPLKCLGVLKSGNQIHNTAIQQKNFLSADYLMYPNDFTRDTMLKSYNITDILTAKALMMGYPRTSGMLKVTDEEKQNLRADLTGPGISKIYAYMPTLRRYLQDEEFMPRVRAFLSYLDSQLTDEELLYVNMHHYHHLNDQLDVSCYGHIEKFPDDVDSYRLLTVTDALITDYSSVFFDYLILKKQVVLYVEDIDEYMENQGLNLDVRSLPLDTAENAEEVIRCLRKGRERDDAEEIADLYRYDRADNPERLCRLFLGDESGLDFTDVRKSSGKKAMFYTDGFISGKESGILCDMAEMHEKEDASCGSYELYLGCDEKLWRKHAAHAYHDSGRVPLITSRSTHPLSSVGKSVLKLYQDGRLSFDRAMSFLSHEYGLTEKLMYGNADFDLMCVYDTADPEMVIGLALSEAEKKMLCLSTKMIKEIRAGSTFLRDAVSFASGYADVVLVKDEESEKLAGSILPRKAAGRIRIIRSAEELDEMTAQLITG